MAFILSIETAVKGCSVAIHEDGNLIADVNLNNERVASSLLTTAIGRVVELSELTLHQLDAVAISEGPGSYTGLRIGLSTAKGLCFSLDKPLLTLSSLEIMTQAIVGLFSEVHALCPMIDARRMEIYSMLLDGNSLEIKEATAAKVVDESSFAELLKDNRVLFFGNGSQKIQHLYATDSNAVFIEKPIYPTAAFMGILAFEKYGKQDFASVPDFEPVYVKPYFATTPKNKLRP